MLGKVTTEAVLPLDASVPLSPESAYRPTSDSYLSRAGAQNARARLNLGIGYKLYAPKASNH